MSIPVLKESGGDMHPSATWSQTAMRIFMGHTPVWYKKLVFAFLVLNAFLVLVGVSKFAVGWLMVAEFIVFLAGALICYPLLPGGLLAIQALAMGMTSPDKAFHEAEANFNVILLLVFVVAGVHFLKDWLEVVFRGILVGIKSKVQLALAFCLSGAVLSANLDALTVIAVVITVIIAIYNLYQAYRSKQGRGYDSDDTELHQFRAFLRSIVMHAAVGTMLGGVMTKVGEPQNLLICDVMKKSLPPELAVHWDFVGFLVHMAVITVPTLVAGLATTVALEKIPALGRWFDYGAPMPLNVRRLLEEEGAKDKRNRTRDESYKLWVQGTAAILLVVGLATHVAEVGFLGLGLIVLATTFTGVSEEHHIGQAFTVALPFCALLVTFFVIVAMIQDQGLFEPIVMWALGFEAKGQQVAFYSTSGGLSTISDNVFVATIFINAARKAYESGLLTPEQFEKLAISINAGTNIPSIATPNGQAAFLFLLTSPLAGLLQLGYGKMLRMALPYTIVVTIVSVTALWYWL